MRTGRQLIAMRLLAGSAAILMHPDAALAQQEVLSAAQEDVSQDIVVTGVRGAQQKAINVKRDAAQIVDSIAAEDIGKLPDATIADSLQRVPGVQITRSAGEGASLNIRGLGQVLTTLNGEQFLGASNITGAQPNLTDVPSELFAGVDVIKSPTARNLSGGVSGIVDLKTRRPFDLPKGLTASVSGQHVYGNRTKDWSQQYSALVGWNNGRFGGLLAVAYDDLTLSNQRPSITNGIRKTTDRAAGFDTRGDGDITNSTLRADGDYFYNPVAFEMSNSITDRQRLGANASAQYQITDSLQLIGDLAYTRLRNRDSGVSAVLHNNFSDNAYQSSSIIDGNGVLEVGNANLFRFHTSTINNYTKARSLNTNVELRFDDGGPFTASARWVQADSKSSYISGNVDAWATRSILVPRSSSVADCTTTPASCVYGNPGGLPSVLASIDFRNHYPAVSFASDVTNPALYSLTSTWAFGNRSEAQLDAYRIDGAYQVSDDGLLRKLQFGGRYGTRDVSNDAFRLLSPISFGGTPYLYYFKDATGINRVNGLNRSLVPVRKFADIPGLTTMATGFGPITGIPALPAINPTALNDVRQFNEALFPGTREFANPTQSYRVNSRDVAAYLQADVGGQLIVPFTGNVGLRYARNSLDIFTNPANGIAFVGLNANNGVQLALPTVKYKNDSDFWLPNANLNFELASDMRLRFAFAKVVGTYDLATLGQGFAFSYVINGSRTFNGQPLPSDLKRFNSGSAGNPSLKLPQSTNYNVSYEWYFSRNSILSVAAFLFDVKSFLQTNTAIEAQPDEDDVVREGGPVTRPANGKGGIIKGVEIGLQTTFDYLPGLLSGFGTQLNYTLSDSSSSNVDLFGRTLPVPDNSRHQVNAVVFYQKGPFQGRVAMNYRSKRFNGLTPAGSDNLAVFTKPTNYLDASLSYDVTPRFTVYVQGTNLTQENEERYAQFKNFYLDQAIFERRVLGGVRIRL